MVYILQRKMMIKLEHRSKKMPSAKIDIVITFIKISWRKLTRGTQKLLSERSLPEFERSVEQPG